METIVNNAIATNLSMSPRETTDMLDLLTLLQRELSEHYGYDMSIPVVAAGQCLNETSKVLEAMSDIGKDDERVQVIYAEHPDMGDDELEVGVEFANHFALVLNDESKTVIDFTMRQFDYKSAFPYIAPMSDWADKLADAWDTYPAFAIGDDICWDCHVGVTNWCECTDYAMV